MVAESASQLLTAELLTILNHTMPILHKTCPCPVSTPHTAHRSDQQPLLHTTPTTTKAAARPLTSTSQQGSEASRQDSFSLQSCAHQVKPWFTSRCVRQHHRMSHVATPHVAIPHGAIPEVAFHVGIHTGLPVHFFLPLPAQQGLTGAAAGCS
jgi:hypothetical protein